MKKIIYSITRRFRKYFIIGGLITVAAVGISIGVSVVQKLHHSEDKKQFINNPTNYLAVAQQKQANCASELHQISNKKQNILNQLDGLGASIASISSNSLKTLPYLNIADNIYGSHSSSAIIKQFDRSFRQLQSFFLLEQQKQQQILSLQSQDNNVTQEINRLKQALQQTQSPLQREAIQIKINALNLQYNSFLGEIVTLKQSITGLNQKILATEQNISTETTANNQLAAANKKLNAEIASYENKYQSAESQIKQLKNRETVLNNQLAALDNIANKLNSEIEILQQIVNELNSAVTQQNIQIKNDVNELENLSGN